MSTTVEPAASQDESICESSAKAEHVSHSSFSFSLPPHLVEAYNSVEVVNGKVRLSPKFSNSLLVGVGFLELANAGDFAANVWNTVPVPKFVVGLMALGGSVALFFSYFALKDAILSRHNLRQLLAERRALREVLSRRSSDLKDSNPFIEARLDVLFREFWTEAISRFGMDVFLGFGAVLISIGTFMAIGGANHKVWLASNYLSGYVGNAPLALYSLVNSLWMAYLWRIARQHGRDARYLLPYDSKAASVLTRRVRRVQMFATVSAITNLLGGTGSLITATRWYGYVILVPVIISSITMNHLWRHLMGYHRAIYDPQKSLDMSAIVSDIYYVTSILSQLSSNTAESSLLNAQSIIPFLVSNELFEDFCVRLTMAKPPIAPFDKDNNHITVESVEAVDDDVKPRIQAIAETCLRKDAPLHFRCRERYLAELLGSYVSITRRRRSALTPQLKS
jgi:hypothetical protein